MKVLKCRTDRECTTRISDGGKMGFKQREKKQPVFFRCSLYKYASPPATCLSLMISIFNISKTASYI